MFSREGWTLLEYVPSDLARLGLAGFRDRLLTDLRALGVPTRAKSEEEIWQEVRQRAIDNFTKTMVAFIGRCRKRDLSVDDLGLLVARHRPIAPTEGKFLDIAQTVYAGYLRRLGDLRLEDFDGLMLRADTAICSGATTFARNHAREHGDLANIRYVHVDEFQDFSAQFYQLLAGIRQVSPSAQFFCVGDDWQAINGFAGGDLTYFEDFAGLFRAPRSRSITTNYRSAPAVVRTGNALMAGLGAPARPHDLRDDPATVSVADLGGFEPSPRERELHQGDDMTPAVLRLARNAFDKGRRVVLLSRRNTVRGYVRYTAAERKITDGLDRFLHHVRSYLPEDDRELVSISTTHRYKGLEQDAVVVLDGLEGSYPLIHPAWVFMRVFGDTLEDLEAEERRLFYVALTRARRTVTILTDQHRPSPYLLDISEHERLHELEWARLPAVNGPGGPRYEVQVHGAFEVKDVIKDLGYHYIGQGRYWAKSYEAEGFDLGTLLEQDWAALAGRILVLSETGESLILWRPGDPTPALPGSAGS